MNAACGSSMLFSRMSPGPAPRKRGRQHQSHQQHQHHSPGQLELIMTIGGLPDAVEPGIHYALDPGFYGVPPVRHARTVMLMVSVGPESGFPEPAARPPPIS